jgi:MFS family permease
MLAPVLPEIGERTDTGPGVAGALAATFALAQLPGYPVFGLVAQRRGAWAVLAASLVLLVVGDAGFVFGDGLAAWFSSRFVQGLGAAGLWIGVTFAILELWPDSAYQRMTGVFAAYAVGAIAGPAMAGVEGIRGPFALHALVALAAFAPLVVLRTGGERVHFGADRSVLRTRAFAVSAAGIVLVSLAVGTVDGPLPLHFDDRLGQTEIAALYVLTAILVAAGAAAAGRVSPRIALWAGAFLIPVGIAVVGATGTVPPWVVGMIVAGAGFGVAEAGALGFLVETVERERILTAWVVWSQLWAIGYLVGPAVAGLVAEAWGFAVLGAVPLFGSLLVVWSLRGGGAVRAPNSAP